LALPLRVYYKFWAVRLIAIVVVFVFVVAVVVAGPIVHVNCICIFSIVRNQRNCNAARFSPAPPKQARSRSKLIHHL